MRKAEFEFDEIEVTGDRKQAGNVWAQWFKENTNAADLVRGSSERQRRLDRGSERSGSGKSEATVSTRPSIKTIIPTQSHSVKKNRRKAA